MTHEEALAILNDTVNADPFMATVSGLAGFVKVCRFAAGLPANIAAGRVTATRASRLLQGFMKLNGCTFYEDTLEEAAFSPILAANVAYHAFRENFKTVVRAASAEAKKAR